MDYPNDLSLNLGYDLPASPHGINLIAQLVLSDLLHVQKALLTMHKDRDKLTKALKELIEEGSSFSWTFKESVLKRVKRYLLLASLQSSSHIANAPLISLRHYFESVERQAKDLHFALISLTPSRQYKEKIQRLNASVESCAHHYAEWIKSFSENENVLLFIIQKRNEIVECFGDGYFEELLTGSFGSIGQVSELLLTSYVNRGFNHIIPTLQKLISSLEYK